MYEKAKRMNSPLLSSII